MPRVIKWRQCQDCSHIFTDGYYSEEALDILLRGTHDSQQVGADAERSRIIWGRVIDKISSIRHSARGRWLDVGIGNGSLLFTAQEWGYETVGLDMRPSNVERMRTLGYEAHCVEFCSFTSSQPFDVISMADVVEHMPFPRQALEHAFVLLRSDGLIFLSMPNTDSAVWRLLDVQGVNPYWMEMEHYHNFSRKNLYRLLAHCGFEPISYSASDRYRCGMEVVARRLPKVESTIQAAATSSPADPSIPRRLNVGCGRNIMPGWINLDATRLPGVDVVADLDYCREQQLPFAANSIDEFLLSHVLEHLRDPLSLMGELHRIARPNARAIIRVPYGSSDDAYEDPTHVRQYFLNSFGYFSQPFYWRADYGYRGDWLTQKITLIVDRKEHEGKGVQDILKQITTLRNVVKEMIAELVAIKPTREPRRELQIGPEIRIHLA